MSTNFIIEALTPAGKKVSRAYVNAKPDATDYELKVLAQGFNALSGHTLTAITRVERTDITNVYGPRDPQLIITPASVEILDCELGKTVTFELSYLGDERAVTFSGKKPNGATITQSGKTVTITGGDYLIKGPEKYQLIVTLPATTDYDETTAAITFIHCDESSVTDV